MVERHQHPEHPTRHAFNELRREVEQLRGQVAAMREELHMMRMLQSAARLLLGLHPEPPHADGE